VASSAIPQVPLELFGSPSIQWAGQSAYQLPAYQVTTATMSQLPAQPSVVASARQELDNKISSLQEAMTVQGREVQASHRELQATINTMAATMATRSPSRGNHYGPAEDAKPQCLECGKQHRGKCWGKCAHCGDPRHPIWNCFKRKRHLTNDLHEELLKKVKSTVATELQQFQNQQQMNKKVKFTVGKDDSSKKDQE